MLRVNSRLMVQTDHPGLAFGEHSREAIPVNVAIDWAIMFDE